MCVEKIEGIVKEKPMATKKKILYIVEAMGGGVFTYIVDLANELVDTYDMYIAYAVRKQTPSNYKEYFDKRIHLIKVKNFARAINATKDIAAFFEIRKIAKEIKPDIIHADVFLLPSRWEGLPISLLESMYMKKICVVSNVIGNRDVIHNGENGLVCSTAEEFADAIKTTEDSNNVAMSIDKDRGALLNPLKLIRMLLWQHRKCWIIMSKRNGAVRFLMLCNHM